MQQQAKQGKGHIPYPIAFDGTDDQGSAKEERRSRLKRARIKRARWEPTKYLAVCSKQFLDEDYSIMFSDLAKVYFQRRLRKDGIGICVFPTIRVPCISIFRWKVSQLEASEVDNKICIHVL